MKTKAGPGCTAVHEVSLAELWRNWGHGQKAAWELGVCTESLWPLPVWDGELPSAFHHFSLSSMNLRKEGLKQKPGQKKSFLVVAGKQGVKRSWEIADFFYILCHVWLAHSPPQIQVPPSVPFPWSLMQRWPSAASPSPQRSSGAALSTAAPSALGNPSAAPPVPTWLLSAPFSPLYVALTSRSLTFQLVLFFIKGQSGCGWWKTQTPSCPASDLISH